MTEPKKITLGAFARLHNIRIVPEADKKAEGRAIPTGQISLPAYYWVHENTYQKMK